MVKTINDLFNTFETLSDEDRVQFTRDWLKQNYGITNVADENWLSLLTYVHDHDNQPYHFGQTEVGTTFKKMTIQLVLLPDGWHLATVKGNRGPVVLHPKHEAIFKTVQNASAVKELAMLLKAGKLIPPLTGVAVPESDSTNMFFEVPETVPNGRVVEKAEDHNELVDETPKPANLIDPNSTSITIDMSKFL